jgi:hypothetical protein
MFKEILKIFPKLDNADLNKMERSLSQRFSKVAKKFGKGMAGVLMGGGIAGAAVGIIDKLLNPLKDVQDAIDRSIGAADDLVTNAEQFNTTPGKLAKLRALGTSTGLDAESLYMLINKFQNAVADAEADKNKPSAVRNYVGIQDSADAFFEFIQALKGMETNQRLLVQQEVFGEKQILKMADFLNTDMKKQLALLAPLGSAAYDKPLQNLGAMKDAADIFQAQRDLQDILGKGATITAEMIQSRHKQLEAERVREDARISNYRMLVNVSETSNKIAFMLEDGLNRLADLIIKVTNMNSIANKMTSGRWWRGLFTGQAGDK